MSTFPQLVRRISQVQIQALLAPNPVTLPVYHTDGHTAIWITCGLLRRRGKGERPWAWALAPTSILGPTVYSLHSSRGELLSLLPFQLMPLLPLHLTEASLSPGMKPNFSPRPPWCSHCPQPRLQHRAIPSRFAPTSPYPSLRVISQKGAALLSSESLDSEGMRFTLIAFSRARSLPSSKVSSHRLGKIFPGHFISKAFRILSSSSHRWPSCSSLARSPCWLTSSLAC